MLNTIIKKYNLKEDEYVYIGDDVNDREWLEKTKFRVTVNNAHKSILKIKDIQVTENNGGEGAFREIVDRILEYKK